MLRDIDLEERRDALQTQISLIDRNVLIQRAHANTAEAIQSDQERVALSQEMAQANSQLASLRITSPVEGSIVTPNVEDKVGSWLKGSRTLSRGPSGLCELELWSMTGIYLMSRSDR